MAVLRATAIALLLTIALASGEDARADDSTKNTKDFDIGGVVANDELRNSTGLSLLDYTIKSTLINYGDALAKVQQRYLCPEGVEVKQYSLENDEYRAKRSTDNQKVTQWVGGMINLKPSDEILSDMTYVNHPEKIYSPNTKTFHKLSTAIMIKEGDLVGGEISSPNYPISYPNGADLTWLIAYPADNVVRLEIQDYATEECCDRIVIYDGFNSSHYPLATFEGNYQYGDSNVVFSTLPAMFIRFTSDCLGTGRGFRATYINQAKNKAPVMSCGSVQQSSGNQGYIRSPNYPGTYDQYMNCTWPVQTYYDTRVRFVVNNFTTGYDDQLVFYDGTPSNPGNRIASLSGNVYSGYTFYASSNQAFAVFSSGYSSDTSNMFDIFYTGENNAVEATTSVPTVSCGGIYYTSSYTGIIDSPNYPSAYPPNMNCTWSVYTRYGTRVIFNIQNFNLKYGDYLYVFDGSPYQPGGMVRSMTGSYPANYTITTTSNNAFLQLFSDPYSQSSSYKFRLNYYGEESAFNTESPFEETTNDVVDDDVYYPPRCNGSIPTLYGDDGDIQSPGYYFTGYYPNNERCIWYINVYSSFDAVRFYIYHFSTEFGCDYVRIYNGYSTSSSNLISVASGYVTPYTTLAMSNSRYATLEFQSDGSIISRGFDIYFYGTYSSYYTTQSPSDITTQDYQNDTCSDTYYASYSGYIASPNYPGYYNNNMNCTTWISTPYDTSLRLTVQSFNLANGDYVKIYDGLTNQYLRTFSGSYYNGYTWQSSSNYIKLVFTTDSYDTSSGYYFRYDGVYDEYYTTVAPKNCGGDTPYNQGNISSIGYPSYYSNDLDCLWTVNVQAYRYVLFTVITFDTENCCDYVRIYGGTPNNSSGLVQDLRGNVSTGTEILVQDRQAFLTFHTDFSVTDPGFLISYQDVPTYYTPSNNSRTIDLNIAPQDSQSDIPRLFADRARPITLGRDLWENAKNKPEHLRKKIEEREQEEIIN